MKSISSQTNQPVSLGLYEWVFNSRLARLFVVCVLSVLLLQPALIAYASTEAVTDTVQAAESPAEEPVLEPDNTTRDEEISEEEVLPAEPPTTSDDDGSSDEATTDNAVEQEETEPATTDPAPTSSSTASVPDPTPVLSTSTASSSGSTQATTSAPTTPESTADTTGTSAVSQSNENETETESAVQNEVHNSSNYYQFSRNDCVRVADGSFYCEQESVVKPEPDSFYVALDADGDKEIFAQRDGEVIQITHNYTDDAAPLYDDVSNTMVWHQLQNGRYQIMSYDFDNQEETQLTEGYTNSMEPSRYGSVTAWQQWHNGNWEIMMFDQDEIVQISSSTAADIAPSVSSEYIVWKRIYEGEQVTMVYSLRTHKATTIDDAELGTRVSNARLLLVYEEVTASGDTVVRGYDPITNAVVPIHTNPASLPRDLPDSEPTSETRAFVPTKTQQEEEELAESTATSSSATTTAASSTASTATTTSDAAAEDAPLVVPSSTASTSTVETASATADATTTDAFTLVIPPNSTSTVQ